MDDKKLAIGLLAVAVCCAPARAQVRPTVPADSLVARFSSDNSTGRRAHSAALRVVVNGSPVERLEVVEAVTTRLGATAGSAEVDARLLHVLMVADRSGDVPGFVERLASVYRAANDDRRLMMFSVGPEGSPRARAYLAEQLFRFLLELDSPSRARAKVLAGLLTDYGDQGLAYLDALRSDPRASETVQRVADFLARLGGG